MVGENEKAIPIFLGTLKQYRKYGNSDPRTLIAINNLAASYWSTKQLDMSIPLFEEAASSLEIELGRNNYQTKSALANLGVNYRDAGKFDEAIPLLEEVHEFSRKEPRLAWVSGSLRSAYLKSNSAIQFLELMDDQLKIERQKFSRTSTDLAAILVSWGADCLVLQQADSALELLEEGFEIRRAKMPNNWLTFNSQSLLGEAKFLTGDLELAIGNMKKGYQGLEEVKEEIPIQFRRQKLVEAIDRIIRFSVQAEDESMTKKWKDTKSTLYDLGLTPKN